MNVPIRDPKWAQRELLSHSPVFSGLAPARLDKLVGAIRLRQLEARESLFRAGQPIREAHFLASGTLTRSTVLAGQRNKIIEFVQTRQFVSLGELFGASRYACSAETVTPCIVVALEIGKLRAAVHQDLDLSWRIIEALAQRQCAIEFAVTGYHYGLTGTQRVLDYLIELAGGYPGLAGESSVTLNTSKKIIASRIGMTPESFSRSLRLLSDIGAIVVEGRNVHIQNAALLNTEVGDTHNGSIFFRRSNTAGARPGKFLSPGALINLCISQNKLKIAMNSLQDTSVKQVFSTLRENFTTTELGMLGHDIDQLLMSSESIEQVVSLAKEALENRRMALTVAA